MSKTLSKVPDDLLMGNRPSMLNGKTTATAREGVDDDEGL